MSQVELKMPKMGESVAEATIIRWLKNEGDHIGLDEIVMEIATDKVDSEIPSSSEGILIKKLYKEGDVVQVGKAVALISSATGAGDTAAKNAEHVKAESRQDKVLKTETRITAPGEPGTSSDQSYNGIPRTSSSGKFYSPLVRSIAHKEGISLAELESINGTGNSGRVTRDDLLAYIPGKKETTTASKEPLRTSLLAYHKPAVPAGENDEIIEMDRMRKLIADHMVMSKQVSPHVTSFVEADVTVMVNWRNKVKNAFESRENEKLTFTPIFIEALVKAIKDFPMINVSVDGTKIIVRKNINIGMAAALPSGNLIVPVIKNADRLNLLGITKAVNDLTMRARTNKLLPDEVQGGTYTLSNVGTFGNVMGTPIINQPQAAIMAVGAIRKKPAVIETPQGDTIGIRHMMFLSHSYDHRIIDGALGGSFVRRVADYLEQFDLNRII